MTRWTLSMLALAAFVSFVFCQGDPYETGIWAKESYPNPWLDVNHCGRNQKKSYVCDPNNVISLSQADNLQRVIDNMISETPCPCSQNSCDTGRKSGGYRAAVAIVKKMEGVSSDASAQDKTNAAHEFAFYLYNKKQYGDFGNCGEVVLILYSQQDGILYIVTGPVARTRVSDKTIGDIINQASEVFRTRGVYEGIRHALDNLSLAFTQKPVVHYSHQGAAIVTASIVLFTACLVTSLTLL